MAAKVFSLTSSDLAELAVENIILRIECWAYLTLKHFSKDYFGTFLPETVRKFVFCWCKYTEESFLKTHAKLCNVVGRIQRLFKKLF